jgi:thymidine phosphorylase
MGEWVKKGDIIFTMYAESADRLKLAQKALKQSEVLKIK